MQIVEAAIASILEVGYYRSSTNEIARRGNLSWGAIQYHFGTREALLLAVIHEIDRRFVGALDRAQIEGDTPEARLYSAYQILASHYDTPTYLVWVQIMLDLRHDPDTSEKISSEIDSVSARAEAGHQRLIREAVGQDATRAETDVLFHALRGLAISRRLADAVTAGAFRDMEREAFHKLLQGMALSYSAPRKTKVGP